MVRAPLFLPRREINRFVESRAEWINEHLKVRSARPEPNEDEIKALIKSAKAELPAKTAHFAEIMRLYPTGIKITSAKTRFGSCSGKNGICYSWRLMQYPAAAVDYVVVHEIAHIAHKNHGKAFYSLIESVLPDYKERRRLLKNA